QNRIFEKFFRAYNAQRKKTRGTGLGLFITKKILEAAGCDIWFESEENRGTTFYVSIPLKGMKQKKGEKQIGT
ncbi:MAG: ATP-binding protein, partial [Candidatus Paceibacterota bacterium]